MNPWLGITLGDPGGIGPEVTAKALALLGESNWRFLLLGDPRAFEIANAHTHLPIQPFRSYYEPGQFFILNPGKSLPLQFAQGGLESAQLAIDCLEEGTNRCLRGELKGLVTAPVNKEAIIHLGKPFTGQTEFLSDLAKSSRTAMMLLGHDDQGRWLRVALVTTHLPLRNVADAITQEKVLQTIELASEACQLLRLKKSRVAVCGLNPHAGEGGEIGREEIDVIEPAIQTAKRKGLDVTGPIPADTLFHYAFKGDYEAVVAMYHDQGLGPLKMIGFDHGINWTLGLPFIRTSPDHGTAYNIAGQNRANPSSMKAAIELALQLSDY
ncbi:MAG: 4-hydroxythreonine-4-phosphate dehydrogenase PdxA [Verrucomicrobiota bacterium]